MPSRRPANTRRTCCAISLTSSCCWAKAQDLGITVDTDLVKKLDDVRKQLHADSMEDLEKAAQAQGISFEDFKQNMKNNLLTQRVIPQEVGGHITSRSAEIQDSTTSTRPSWSARAGALERDPDCHPDQARTGQQERSGCTPEAPAQKTSLRRKPRPTRFTTCSKGRELRRSGEEIPNGPTAPAGGDLEYFKRGTLVERP